MSSRTVEIALPGSVSSLTLRDMHFARGMEQGREHFVEEDSERVLTDADVMEFVQSNLSLEKHRECNAFQQHMGWELLPYSYCVGFVVGWLGALLSA